MTKRAKTITKIISGTADSNVDFAELCGILSFFGFSVRIKGSHHIYFKEKIEEIINIQPKGTKAKAYQVKQVREILVKYKLTGNEAQV